MDGDEVRKDPAGARQTPESAGAGSPEMELPEDQILVVPAHPSRDGGAVNALQIETRLLPDGHAVAMAFTDLDKLVAALGEHQPWIAVRAGSIKGLLENSGVFVLLNPTIDAQAPRWTAADREKAAAGGPVAF
jgi:hypothetical protein